MDDTEGSSSSPSWSPNADQIPYAYTDFAWGADIDTNATGLEWNKDWLEGTSLNFESSQTTSNASGDSLQYQPGTNFSGECDNSGVYAANELEILPVPNWNNSNETLGLANLDDLDNLLSLSPTDMNGVITNSPSSLDYSIGPIFSTTSTDLLAKDIHCNPFPATFNHTEAQQAYESYPIEWTTHLPILDNTVWDPMQTSLYISSSTGVHLPSISSATLSPISSNSEIMSSPTQYSNTNTSISTSQSNSNSTTPSSDRSTSNSPPSTQNEYTCIICSKTFSKRFEFNKHKPLHTLPHACTLCPHRTARRRDMARHIAAKHKDVALSGPRPVSKPICPVEDCKQGFARSDHLLRHLRRKHPGYELRS
ncbi:putative krueppel c2h2-type zinc finger protein [Botrytis fragariae]|uniref:Putative krueppel c2h2-type zinc finger protein n=1 Tax=Botrytis fragariae TaxID=1964551 RepID=A0A8H6EFR4_9HELO|nr:putative krueppel c2h2-type zinc finger protein [Botrytis fragariae]KAF5870498.1 putative krueppel c2h2-type zinc finger protein [Botrytis fragariae]